MWCNKGMNVFPCPTSAAALCHGPSPGLRLSSAAALTFYCRDTQSLLGLVFASHHPYDVVSLQNGGADKAAALELHFIFI